MSDINNNNLQNQNQEFSNDNTLLDNESSVNRTESGSTYWESGSLQNSNGQTVQSYNQAPMRYDPYTGQPIGNNHNLHEAPQKKKARKAPFVIAVVIILLVALSATAFAFSGKIKNSVAMMSKSPAEYYAYVENKSIDQSIDKMFKYMNSNQDMAQETSVKLTYDKDTISAILQSSMGMSIDDFEAVVGIPLDSIGLDIIAAKDDHDFYQEIGINLNNIDIISAEIFMNFAAKEMMLRLPQLSTAYLQQSLELDEYGADSLDMEGFIDLQKRLSSDETADFIKRYAHIITDNVTNVELTKGEDFSVGDMTVKANLLTVTYTSEDLLNIAMKVLEEAEDDKYILDLLPLLSISEDDYKYGIYDALDEIEYALLDYDDDSELLIMDVYVDSNGNILGHNLSFKDDGYDVFQLGYSNVEQNNKGSYEIYLTEPSYNVTLSVSGNHTIQKGAYTGLAVVEFDDGGYSNISFDVKYEDLKLDYKNNRTYTYGNINISSLMMMGMGINIDFDVDGDKQLTTISLKMGNSPLVSLETATKYLKDFKIPKPDRNADVYDLMYEGDEYLSTINIEEYLSKLSDRLGVDLLNLYENLFMLY